MNSHNVISLPVAVDLTGKEHSSVKLTSTGINLAGPGDRVIGTMLRAEVKRDDNLSPVGMAADVALSGGIGVHFIRIGNNAAIAFGDSLEQAPNGSYQKRASRTGTATYADDLVRITAHGFSAGQRIMFTTLTTTSGTGLAIGTIYWVSAVGLTADVFKVCGAPGATPIDIGSADYSALTIDTEEAGVAVMSAALNSATGIIQALLFTVAGGLESTTPVSTGSGNVVLSTSPTIVTPLFSTGCTASGAGSFDLSGSSATFKTPTGRFTFEGPVSHKVVNTAVAAAGADNTDAGTLTSVGAQHVTSDSAAKGVKLPVGVAGDDLTIINDSGTSCELYPDAGGNVNGGTTTTGSVTIPANSGVRAICTAALTWRVLELGAKAS